MTVLINKEITLSDSQLFGRLPKDKLETLDRGAQKEIFPARTMVFQQGDAAEKFYFIISGAVTVFRKSKNGIRTDLSTLGPGDHFGEMALVATETRSASVETTHETHLLVLDKDLFEQILQNHPSVSLSIMKQMSRWVMRDELMIEKEAERQFEKPNLSWRDFVIVISVSIFLGLLFNLANPNGIDVIQSFRAGEQIASVSLSMAYEKYKDGKTIFVDARPSVFYDQSHIRDSVNVPEALFEISYAIGLGGIDSKHDIIVYGRTFSSLYDEKVANKLVLRGHKRTMVLKNGLDAWIEKGYPVQP